jgi:NADH-quinone oxidoreductase subunit J
MNFVFYLSAAIALLATIATVIQYNAVHALLYLIVSLLAAAVIFYTLGAPFVAALEVLIHAGAIMVLFVFAVMMLNLGPQAKLRERQMLHPSMWLGPAILASILLLEVAYVLVAGLARQAASASSRIVDARLVGVALFGPYALAVELTSMLLLAGLVAAYHVGQTRRAPSTQPPVARPAASPMTGDAPTGGD